VTDLKKKKKKEKKEEKRKKKNKKRGKEYYAMHNIISPKKMSEIVRAISRFREWGKKRERKRKKKCPLLDDGIHDV